jgi:serine/threonine protein kinase
MGVGSLGPVFRGEDPQSRAPVAITQFQLNLSPEAAGKVADGLQALQGLISHVAAPRVIDAGIQRNDPFLVTALVPGESLDAALREFGPAAIADALPRLRLLAEALDRSAASGAWHGALQPRDVLISGSDTHLLGLGVTPILERHGVRRATRRPYAAPELTDGNSSSPKADQYALGAIAYEWFFGGRAPTSAEAVLDAPPLPGVNAEALASALMTALATNPSERFTSCTAFVDAIDEALVSSALDLSEHEQVLSGAGLLPLEAFVAEDASDEPDDIPLREPARTAPPRPAPPADKRLTPPRSLDLDAPTAPLRLTPEPVAWQGTLGASSSLVTPPPRRRGAFSSGIVLAALIGGAALGGAAGYLFATSGLASPTVAAPDDSAPGAAADVQPAKEFTDTPVASPTVPPQSTTLTPPPDAARAAVGSESSRMPSTVPAPAPAPETPTLSPDTASLLVRSSPSGAVVSVDGITRGTTPLTLRDLALGTRTVAVSRPGYATSERRVALTTERPSRSVDFQLSPTAASTARAAREPRPAATTSTLFVDSRPSGSSVVINGQVAGTTPLTLESVAPGTVTITIERQGYRPYIETIELKAGERRRVAASLELVQE